MPEHKHAAILRAIADGVPRSEFEVLYMDELNRGTWQLMQDRSGELVAYSSWVTRPDLWEVRRKPQHILVNGFKVPKPLDVVPDFSVYFPSVSRQEMYDVYIVAENMRRAVERGIAHLTAEAAIAHAKAMCGIDPKWEE